MKKILMLFTFVGFLLIPMVQAQTETFDQKGKVIFDLEKKIVEFHGALSVQAVMDAFNNCPEISAIQEFKVTPTFPSIFGSPGKNFYMRLVLVGRCRFLEIYGELTVKEFIDKVNGFPVSPKEYWVVPTYKDGLNYAKDICEILKL